MNAQPPLFDVDTPPVRTPRRPAAPGKPAWSKYRPKAPMKCDDCMMVLALAKGDAPASRRARWRRRIGTTDLLLCYAHADVRREEDGLERLEHGA